MVDLFKMSKHKPIEENVLFTAKVLYENLTDHQHIDELFETYVKEQAIELSLNIERILYLALCFLFALGKIRLKNNIVMRVEQ